MGFRYRSSIRLAKSLRINLSKSGASLSVGRPGATLNFGRRGIRTTVGLPGTGLSYSQTKPWHEHGRRPEAQLAASPAPARRGSSIVGWFLVFFIMGAVIALFAR